MTLLFNKIDQMNRHDAMNNKNAASSTEKCVAAKNCCFYLRANWGEPLKLFQQCICSRLFPLLYFHEDSPAPSVEIPQGNRKIPARSNPIIFFIHIPIVFPVKLNSYELNEPLYSEDNVNKEMTIFYDFPA